MFRSRRFRVLSAAMIVFALLGTMALSLLPGAPGARRALAYTTIHNACTAYNQEVFGSSWALYETGTGSVRDFGETVRPFTVWALVEPARMNSFDWAIYDGSSAVYSGTTTDSGLSSDTWVLLAQSWVDRDLEVRANTASPAWDLTGGYVYIAVCVDPDLDEELLVCTSGYTLVESGTFGQNKIWYSNNAHRGYLVYVAKGYTGVNLFDATTGQQLAISESYGGSTYYTAYLSSPHWTINRHIRVQVPDGRTLSPPLRAVGICADTTLQVTNTPASTATPTVTATPNGTPTSTPLPSSPPPIFDDNGLGTGWTDANSVNADMDYDDASPVGGSGTMIEIEADGLGTDPFAYNLDTTGAGANLSNQSDLEFYTCGDDGGGGQEILVYLYNGGLTTGHRTLIGTVYAPNCDKDVAGDFLFVQLEIPAGMTDVRRVAFESNFYGGQDPVYLDVLGFN